MEGRDFSEFSDLVTVDYWSISNLMDLAPAPHLKSSRMKIIKQMVINSIFTNAEYLH
jgi:hypothetical protein